MYKRQTQSTTISGRLSPSRIIGARTPLDIVPTMRSIFFIIYVPPLVSDVYKRQNYIGTEHILAGLLAVKDSTAGEILTEAGISLKKLLELMEKLVAPSSEVLLEEPQGYTCLLYTSI